MMKFSKTAVLVHIIIIVIIIPTTDAAIVISVPRSRSFPGERCGRGRRRSGRRRTAAQRDRHAVFLLRCGISKLKVEKSCI